MMDRAGGFNGQVMIATYCRSTGKSLLQEVNMPGGGKGLLTRRVTTVHRGFCIRIGISFVLIDYVTRYLPKP